MVWYRKSAMRVMSLFLLVLMVFSMGVTPVYATEATTEENVGTSLYSVTTALTAFANNVVGANTNDKHADDSDETKNHRLWELSNNVTTGRVHVGDAGAIIGYGDKTKGFISYISANETRSVTTSSYGAYVNVGDDGRSYAYARYGRLLNELGIDQTGNPSSAPAGRAIGGRIVQGAHLVSSFVPTLFDVVIDIMRLLNPFRFLVNDAPVSGAITSWDVGTGPDHTISDAFGGGPGGSVEIGTGDVTADQMDGVDQFTGPGIPAALDAVSQKITEIYVLLRQIGLIIIIPMMLTLLIAAILLTARAGHANNNWGRIKVFLIRLVFICIGIPMLGVLYTATLDEVQSIVLTQAPSSRIIAASFVDFENWVKTSRLDPPSGGSFELKSEGISESESQGRASADSWRTVRETIYQINHATDLYKLDGNSGLGITVGGNEIDTNAGMWDTDGKFTQFGTNAANRKVIFTRLNSLLDMYSSGAFYTASAWESNINSSLTANFQDDLGSTQSTDPASSNKKTIYQMYFDTDEVDDWMNRSVENNGEIFDDVADGVTDGPEEAKWAHMKWNIFCNGTDIGVTPLPGDDPSVDEHGKGMAEVDITYKSSIGAWGDAINPANPGALSTVSMYNYLASAFNESNISVYSAANTTSEYTRVQHYSANLAGSGFMGTLFLVNCIVCLGVFVIIGLFYCLGMLLHNLKTGLALIMSIPGAMLGVLKSIIQVVVYVIKMIIELFGTIFLYQFVGDLVIIFASAVEAPVVENAANIEAAAVAGGVLASGSGSSLLLALAESKPLFLLSLAAVVVGLLMLGFTMVKLVRPVLVVWSYAWMKVMRLLTLPEFLPVFDAWAANRKSLYIWDELAEDMVEVKDVCVDVLHEAELPAISEGGVVKC